MNSINVIAFDLDNTLHDFSKSANLAINSVCTYLSAAHPELNFETIKNEYATICKQYVTFFTDGRPSHYYRHERMQALLRHLSIYNSKDVSKCVELYKKTINDALCPEEGMLETLSFLNKIGIRIGIVSEGPHDAQEYVLSALGITPYLHFFVTSNKTGISKVDGLYREVLCITREKPEHVLVVGDSLERDIKPAELLGMHALHYNRYSKNKSDKEINHLQELQLLLSQRKI